MGIPEIKSTDKRHISRDDIPYKEMIFGQTPIKEIENNTTLVKAVGVIGGIAAKWTRYKAIKTIHEYDVSQINYDNNIIGLVERLVKEKTNPNTGCN